MKIDTTWIKEHLVWILTVFAFLGVSGVATFWQKFGWLSPEVIYEEMGSRNDAVLSAIQSVSVKQDVFTDQWVCDEDEEELVALLQMQAVEHSIQRQVDIDQLRSRMDDRDCTRFE